MNKPAHKKIIPNENVRGVVTITREKSSGLRRPTAGKAAPSPLLDFPVDTAPAKPEPLAEPRNDPDEVGLDPTLPTPTGPVSSGHQVPDSPSEEEDADGRSVTEQLFESGAAIAERDKVHEATRAIKTGKRSES